MSAGTRFYPNKYGFLRLPDGGYGKDMSGKWWCRPPGAHMQPLFHHMVREYADGTVTVSQQIKSGNGFSTFMLERGLWEKV